MQRPFNFLVVLLLMFSGEVWGQCDEGRTSSPVRLDTFAKECFSHAKSYKAFWKMAFGKQFVKPSSENVIGTNRFRQNSKMNYCISVPCNCIGETGQSVRFSLKDFVSKNYFDDRLGIFCKKELQLEKITSVPIRFRLGSLDYVNWMEGKPNAVKPN